MLRVNEIKLSINEALDRIPYKIKKKLKIKEDDWISYSIFRESIDARKKEIHFVYTVDIEVKNEEKVLKYNPKKVTKTPDLLYRYPQKEKAALKHRPVVIGFGPCGMFAALILAELGFKPIVLERGKAVEERIQDVDLFWKEGLLNTESNVQFGEGGAGTFSDGKLTTRIKDIKRCRKVLKTLIEAGAPEDILYKQKPHVGTDILRNVIKNIRNQITKLGGEIKFNSKVTDLIIEENSISGVKINNREEIMTDAVILALGHSARDTIEMLFEKSVALEQKPFSMGVRIEHPQKLINQVQFGEYAGHPKLGAADYKLSYHCRNGRGVYSFCMCPGGLVIGSASEAEGVVTNGMSYHNRSGDNANSALLVDIKTQDYDRGHPLDGVAFQRTWERKAWEAGGKNFTAPAQSVGDFLGNPSRVDQKTVESTYLPGTKYTDLTRCLPSFVTESLKEALPKLGKKLKGFDMNEAMMTGIETRSSSPVRILRDQYFESNIKGLFPSGEGAGYAGGIISAAVDGIKAAEFAVTNKNQKERVE
ncbi:MAG: NAD(P)/FAD-dependent oxidoreductase [Clostridia bacterium]|nr:NAD(P)/FAD-dependent oxidoreductase [Clostridia bacterium]